MVQDERHEQEPFGILNGFDQIISAIVSEVEGELKKKLQADPNVEEPDLKVEPIGYRRQIQSGTFYYVKVNDNSFKV
jgi:hypothetical protein